jgi:hypothetical protein
MRAFFFVTFARPVVSGGRQDRNLVSAWISRQLEKISYRMVVAIGTLGTLARNYCSGLPNVRSRPSTCTGNC